MQVTLREASGLRLDGPTVAQDSWFPGYAWTVAYCARCFEHMGWRFTPLASGPSAGEPPFWGLRRGQLTDEEAPTAGDGPGGDELELGTGDSSSGEGESSSFGESRTSDESEADD